MPVIVTSHPWREIFSAFLRLGLTSFGGPVAHLGYLRTEFVTRRRWLSEEAYADLVALCQFLPGPASSQVVFALGMQRAGLAGGIAASLGFTLPSAVLMISFAYAVANGTQLHSAGWLHGLKLAAVAVVAQAVVSMGKTLCPDARRRLIALLAAACLMCFPQAGVQMGVIALGALLGGFLCRDIPSGEKAEEPVSSGRHWGAVTALIMFGGLLVGLPWLAAASGEKNLAIFDSFYRAGAMVFGGGHVVLPLLRAEIVPRGWLGDDTFLAGYGAAQALPGPLFTFAAYLGTALSPWQPMWVGGLWALLAIFLPAWLLIGGALPFWQKLRTLRGTQAVLRGANAAVVGVLLAALWNPVGAEAVHGLADLLLAGVAFALLQFAKWPAWLVVLLLAAAGMVLP